MVADPEKAADLSREKLAQQVGGSAAVIYRIEAGKANPKLDTLRKIARALGTTISELTLNER